MRLSRAFHHMPGLVTGRERCQLHRWASGQEKFSNTVVCRDCNVVLCVGCYNIFHTTADIVGVKQHLKNAFKAEKK